MLKINYTTAKGLLERYFNLQFSQFTNEQKDLANEMKNKLADLCAISDEIVDLMNALFPEGFLTPDEDDVVSFMGLKIRLKRANPNVPIKLDNASVAYPRGDGERAQTKNTELEKKLERRTIEFYQTAHRIIHIAENIPGLKDFKCKEVRIIRNHLIEHPDSKDSKITYDSFAYSKNEGPYVKGLRKDSQSGHRDRGFKANSASFLTGLEKVLIQCLNSREASLERDGGT